jgi:hypothetical protein
MISVEARIVLLCKTKLLREREVYGETASRNSDSYIERERQRRKGKRKYQKGEKMDEN